MEREDLTKWVSFDPSWNELQLSRSGANKKKPAECHNENRSREECEECVRTVTDPKPCGQEAKRVRQMEKSHNTAVPTSAISET